jgi:predicted nuclease of restriction endonuclease-like (RecB) superfamily
LRKWFGIELEIPILKEKVLQLVSEKDKVMKPYKVIDHLSLRKEIIQKFISSKDHQAHMNVLPEISLQDYNKYLLKKI